MPEPKGKRSGKTRSAEKRSEEKKREKKRPGDERSDKPTTGAQSRILFVLWAANLGGVQSSIRTRIQGLKALGVPADVFFLHPGSGRDSFQGVRTYVSRHPASFRALVARHRYRAISFINLTPMLQPLRQLNYKGTLVFELRGLSQRGLQICAGLSAKAFKAIVVPSRYVAELVHSAGSGAGSAGSIPVEILYNAVDTSLFRPLPAVPRRDVPAHPVLLWVGRLDWNKNFIELMRIGRLLAQQGRSFVIWVVSDINVSKYTHRFRQAVKAAGLEDRVHLFPNMARSDMPRLYNLVAKSGGLVLSTSRSEGLQNSLLEGMACGCPVVSSAVGGNREIVIDGVTGALYPLGEPAAAAARISEIMDNPRLHRRLAAAGLQRIKEHFGPKRHARAFLRIIGSSTTHSTTKKK